MCKRKENPELGRPSEPAGYRKLGEVELELLSLANNFT